jgi:hypothetical protein
MLWLILGCYSSTDFEADYAVAACSKVYDESCYDEDQLEFFPWDDAEDCIENKEPDVELPAEESCDFSPRDARDCVEQTEELSCDDFKGGRFPNVCHVVCGGELDE